MGLRKAGSRRRWAFVKCLTHFRFIRASTLKEVQLNIKFRVELSQSERDQLDALLSGGRHATRKIKRAQILVAANDGLSDEAIAATLKVSGSTIYRTKRRFVEANLEGALSEEPRPGVARKLSSKEEALLVATACSKPPPGRARWTLELLADEMVRLEVWFSILQGQSLSGASFTSLKQLEQHIDAYIKAYNDKAEPFVWTKKKVRQRRFKGRRITQL